MFILQIQSLLSRNKIDILFSLNYNGPNKYSLKINPVENTTVFETYVDSNNKILMI